VKNYIYLCLHVNFLLNQDGSFLFGNLIIAPLQHKTSFKELDNDEIKELNNFKLSLKKMFDKCGYDIIFMETVTDYCYKKDIQ
jgi:hypothetical protein